MKTAYTFQTVLDLGAMGLQNVEVDYSYDPATESEDLMTVYLLDGGRLGADITDYLHGSSENLLHEAISIDCARQLAEAYNEAQDANRERLREAAWEIEP